MPNLTYWLFGGYIAWLLISGKYKSMLTLASTSSWSTTATTSNTPTSTNTTASGNTPQISPQTAKTGAVP